MTDPDGESAQLANSLFRPRSIAVLGASDDPGKLSGRTIDYLKRYGFAGRILPVNPSHQAVQGLPALASIGDIDGPVDLAVIAVPAAGVPQSLRECVAAGVPVAVVFAAGFGEAGDGGTELQEQVRAICDETGIRVLGPNCLGVLALGGAVIATFSSAMDQLPSILPGRVAMVSQSGAVATYLFSAAQTSGLGIGYLVSTGNEVDLTVSDVLSSLFETDDAAVVLLYVEALRDVAAFGRAMNRARALDRPVLAIKAGSSAVGAEAARRHTGSRTGDDVLYDGVLRQMGVLRVGGMQELLDGGRTFASGRRAQGDRLTIVTMSGGVGVVMADAAQAAGLRVDAWTDAWRAQVAGDIPYFGSTRNPIDVTASILDRPDLLEKALRTVLQHPDTDLLAVALGNAEDCWPQLVEAVSTAYASTDKPMAVVWTGGSGTPLDALNRAGIPTFADPGRTVAVLAMLATYARGRTAAVRRTERLMPGGDCEVQLTLDHDETFGPVVHVRGPGDRVAAAMLPLSAADADELASRVAPGLDSVADAIERLAASWFDRLAEGVLGPKVTMTIDRGGL